MCHQIDVLLLDTQATEHVALRGARQVIDRCRPACLVEFWPEGIRTFGDDPVRVIDEYRAAGFEMSVLDLPHLPADLAAPALVVAVETEIPERFATLVLRPERA